MKIVVGSDDAVVTDVREPPDETVEGGFWRTWRYAKTVPEIGALRLSKGGGLVALTGEVVLGTA